MASINGSILILGASGGVGNVVLRKCMQAPQVFGRIVCASRDLKKYEEVNRALGKSVEAYEVDAREVEQLIRLLKKIKPDLLINVGLPYWNLNVMQACLETGTNGMDTACFEPEHEAHYRHKEQWNFHEDFVKAGLMFVIGCGFDPGVSNAWVANARRFFKEIHGLDIMDCNGGSHGQAFVSNFNLVINLRELLGRIRYYLMGEWIYASDLIDPEAVHQTFNFEKIGKREMYLLFHEELESLAENFPEIGRMRFWMTFGEQYIQCLRAFVEMGLTSIDRRLISQRISPMEFLVKNVGPTLITKHQKLLDDIGMTSRIPVAFGMLEISPLEFLQKVLPEPSSLGRGYTGKTNISCRFEGIGNDGRFMRYRVGQISSHQACFKEVSAQGISYTTGVPAMVGAMMMLCGKWKKIGVYNVEQLSPVSFLDGVAAYGLPFFRQLDDEVPDVKEFEKTD